MYLTSYLELHCPPDPQRVGLPDRVTSPEAKRVFSRP
jgi:hypothetical protein